MSDSQDGEKVGPGHPPRKYRFTKGKSGDPRGRPRGSLNRETIRNLCYAELFERTLAISVGGGRKQISIVRALIRVWVQQGLNKDAAVIEKIFSYAARIAADAPEIRIAVDRAQDDDAILRRFTDALNRRSRGTQGQDSQEPPGPDQTGGSDD
ncbi:DUF5681 domain-containing protein [Methylobacterium tardum]|uniref:DUF5681 domain-containing protein n=1 Tax=Methylobacterium tardum TaxID=374432 RepID=A0AA37TI32_9HYPH|nr:DUF5681 domain-containing protein [Methylobacterium tardum]URD37961.1 DUF5681 domain-containing protein [Methylobacterium tardum]GLS70247.1 hypothetical protein GCM10007890_22600 [Methylobacterium tardum]